MRARQCLKNVSPARKWHANECKAICKSACCAGSLDAENKTSPASTLAFPSLCPRARQAEAPSLTHKTMASKGQDPVLLGC